MFVRYLTTDFVMSALSVLLNTTVARFLFVTKRRTDTNQDEYDDVRWVVRKKKPHCSKLSVMFFNATLLFIAQVFLKFDKAFVFSSKSAGFLYHKIFNLRNGNNRLHDYTQDKEAIGLRKEVTLFHLFFWAHLSAIPFWNIL